MNISCLTWTPAAAAPTLARLALPALAAVLVTTAHATSPTPAAGAAAAPAAETTPSGLVYRALKTGDGPSPQATDTVRVHYRGTFPDGREFDSSHARGQPLQFPLNRVIRCWTEGVQKMKVGGKASLVCPAAIAYGERGTPNGPIPPNATLHFEVELLGIVGR
jgi:FKBP-type peptidyl-prolyl cis-trans isomerase FkpA